MVLPPSVPPTLPAQDVQPRATCARRASRRSSSATCGCANSRYGTSPVEFPFSRQPFKGLECHKSGLLACAELSELSGFAEELLHAFRGCVNGRNARGMDFNQVQSDSLKKLRLLTVKNHRFQFLTVNSISGFRCLDDLRRRIGNEVISAFAQRVARLTCESSDAFQCTVQPPRLLRPIDARVFHLPTTAGFCFNRELVTLIEKIILRFGSGRRHGCSHVQNPAASLGNDHLFSVSVGRGLATTGQRRGGGLETKLASATFGKSHQVASLRFWKGDTQVETSPKRVIECFWKVGGCDNESLAVCVLQFLHKRDDDSIKLANFHRTATSFSQSVNLIEQQDARSLLREAKQLTKSQSCLTEVSANQRIKTNEESWKFSFGSKCSRSGALAAARWPVK